MSETSAAELYFRGEHPIARLNAVLFLIEYPQNLVGLGLHLLCCNCPSLFNSASWQRAPFGAALLRPGFTHPTAVGFALSGETTSA
jgi:hypothetical protein